MSTSFSATNRRRSHFNVSISSSGNASFSATRRLRSSASTLRLCNNASAALRSVFKSFRMLSRCDRIAFSSLSKVFVTSCSASSNLFGTCGACLVSVEICRDRSFSSLPKLRGPLPVLLLQVLLLSVGVVTVARLSLAESSFMVQALPLIFSLSATVEDVIAVRAFASPSPRSTLPVVPTRVCCSSTLLLLLWWPW